jgi:hypothetical protein
MTEAERYQKRKEYYRAYAKANREKRQAYKKAWVKAHFEQYRAAQRASQRRRRGQDPDQPSSPSRVAGVAKNGLKRPANAIVAPREPVNPLKMARMAVLRARLAALKQAKEAA